eukprot:TRINITY_DN17964_c0_g1_i1.p1 TRINITY_DN17964_c0_g1~~TRINITY_DN17964_c0_g1_i1.p1  ORF type:complete len:152 (-),score=24.82 TRINITY_DN17964_c0_g1_i1:346-801(-)
MAPKAAARNASPAPRALKKAEDTKENDHQNAVSDESGQVPKKLQTTQEEPRAQGKTEALKCEGVPLGARSLLASACCSIRAFACSIFLRGKFALFAFLVLLMACVVLQSASSSGLKELATKLQSVYSWVKSVTYQGSAGLASEPSQASVDL